MTGNEIRQKFIEYFERHGHKIVHSSAGFSARRPDDFIHQRGNEPVQRRIYWATKNAITTAPFRARNVSARAAKHNDLDEVGKTARHHTFFEMLGNFSFGDYFKEDAINFAWDFLVNELKLDVNRVSGSRFSAATTKFRLTKKPRELWIKAGASPDRVLRFGRKDNFWQMARHRTVRTVFGNPLLSRRRAGKPGKKSRRICQRRHGDMTMEIWNLVFMQYRAPRRRKRRLSIRASARAVG